MFILLGKVVFFGSATRNKSAEKGGGTYDVYSVSALVDDGEGTSHFCDCEAAYGARVSCTPREGDIVRFVCKKCDFTMPKGVITFSDVLPVVVPKPRELKQ